MNIEKIAQVRIIANCIIETVHEVGEAPADPIYAALMTHGASHEQVKSLLDGAVKGGLLTYCDQAHIYRTTPMGLEFAGIKQ